MGRSPHSCSIIIIVSRGVYIISGFQLVASDKGLWYGSESCWAVQNHLPDGDDCADDSRYSALSLVTSIVMWAALILTVVSLLADYLIKNKDCLADQK